MVLQENDICLFEDIDIRYLSSGGSALGVNVPVVDIFLEYLYLVDISEKARKNAILAQPNTCRDFLLQYLPELYKVPHPSKLASCMASNQCGYHPIQSRLAIDVQEIEGTIFGVSIGGTCIKRAVHSASGNEVQVIHQGKVRKEGYASQHEFRAELFGEEILVQLHDSGKKYLSMTLARAIEKKDSDYFITHLSDKTIIPGLASGGWGDGENGSSDDKIGILASLVSFFASEGIDAHDISVCLSPNDAISTIIAYEHIDLTRKPMGFISGTGGNSACIKDNLMVNCESGMGMVFPRTTIDDAVFTETGVGGGKGSIECMFTGKVLTNLFIKYISSLADQTARGNIESALSGKDLNADLLKLAFDKNSSGTFLDTIDSTYHASILVIIEALIKRAAAYSATVLASTEEYAGGDCLAYGDGSLVSKNPKFVALINTYYKGMTGNKRDILVIQELFGNGDADASLMGTMKLPRLVAGDTIV